MKRTPALCMTLIAALCLAGCYAATVETGKPPAAKTITKKWASCWVFGLVPPKTIESATECPNGVSKVETQLSFLNQLVSLLTLGIYTPMQIVVTCAEGSGTSLEMPGTEIELPELASSEEIRGIFMLAAEEAVRTGQPVYVRRTGAGPVDEPTGRGAE